MQRRLLQLFALAALASVLCVFDARDADALAHTRVFINGIPTPVSFNDGDSFRIHEGEFRNAQCRLAGFNTLESFGPHHWWEGWHPYELFILAKRATANGRRGTWHCTTDGRRDGYGRLLMYCPDLAISQIRHGLAHAMEIEDVPARPEYLRAQQEAIAARRGIWARGVPDFIMTSIHSADEDPTRATHGNRLISTRDGHSEYMEHRDTYGECQWVCNHETRVDEAGARAIARELRTALGSQLSDYGSLHLTEFVARFARTGQLPEYLAEPARTAVFLHLERVRAERRMPETRHARGACALYVAFDRRYGNERASCMRGHGPSGPDDVGGH